MSRFFVLVVTLLGAHVSNAQINAALFRFPDVSQSHIVFTYGNDLWVVPKTGGLAHRLSSPPGVESFPKFSPDGKTIAFTANYDGNEDVYTIPALGGVPLRLTYHGQSDRVVDWHPDGNHILFASPRESGRERFNQFYKMSKGGGLPEKLPLPYAEFGSFSPDGKQLALTFRSQVFRNWKRYRGGWNAAIHIFNLENYASENISINSNTSDELPMWVGSSIFFLSDRGAEQRMNLWEYNASDKSFRQLTDFKDVDIHYPSLGPEEIVYEAGGKLYLFSLANRTSREVKIEVVTDGLHLKPEVISAGNSPNQFISPDGSRVLVEARGEIFNLPAENGFVKNMTQSSGVFERYPSWSPDGKFIAYWSDRSGEYELMLRDAAKDTQERKLSSFGPGFRYSLFWSPDSKKVAFIDKAMKVWIYDVTSNQATEVDQGSRLMHGSCERFRVSWSADSRWILYDRDVENWQAAVFLYDYQQKKRHQVTSGYYNAYNSVFDPDGKYIYLLTNQFFSPLYSEFDNTFVYANSTRIAAIPLKKLTPSPIAPKNDEVTIDDVKEEKAEMDAKKEKSKKGSDEKKKDIVAPVEIDIDGLESRMVILPMAPGVYGNLAATQDKLIFHQLPNNNVSGGKRPLKVYDFKERKEKTIVDDVENFQLSADGSKLLLGKEESYYVVKAEADQKMGKKLPTEDMRLLLNPREEWKQILTDAWRLQRDYFYDAGMHGVDWNKMKIRYHDMLTGALTREEVNWVLGEMIGELNASHTYKGGGAEETPKSVSVGYLGVDWQRDGEYYKIRKIIRAAPWDAEVRSPLDASGVSVREGDFILAVNGIRITTATEPYAAFQGLAGKTVELTYNTTASLSGAKTVIVETLNDEVRLRHLAWIEENRRRVDEATGGTAGYIYVRSTGIDGQNELIRQFAAQINKKSLIIDERFNSGGQIPDRFIEMLNRPPMVFWATRDGAPWPWPPAGNFGPKVMLINGWSGSGGDAFPDYFRKAGLGPLIGSRTWGGLIGISGAPPLIDGGVVTVPTFRMYDLNGTWFREGHGVDPDIPVAEDLTEAAKGRDVQLERGIAEIQSLLKAKGFQVPAIPPFEIR